MQTLGWDTVGCRRRHATTLRSARALRLGSACVPARHLRLRAVAATVARVRSVAPTLVCAVVE